MLARRELLRRARRARARTRADSGMLRFVSNMSDGVPGDLDVTVPSPARMYDYWLGGKDHFAADRRAADQLTTAVPQLPLLARENRKFLGRAVRYCAEAGITQFLDIGSGLPTMDSVHEVAGRVAENPHVVYVDFDQLAVTHASALLHGPGTAAVRGDVTRPGEILAHPDVTRLIDFSRPVAVLLVAVLHFVGDELDPAGALARLRDAMAPGSYLVLSHVEAAPGQATGRTPETATAREMASALEDVPTAPARTRDEIAAFFGGMPLVEPGLTEVWAWRPGADDGPVDSSDVMTVVGGVARKN